MKKEDRLLAGVLKVFGLFAVQTDGQQSPGGVIAVESVRAHKEAGFNQGILKIEQTPRPVDQVELDEMF